MSGRRSRMIRRSMAVAMTAKPAAMAMVALTPEAASAATTNVACSAPALKTAITNANAASGSVLSLASGCTYDIANAFVTGDALPPITTTMTIQGNGATLTRHAGSADFRILHVTRGGNLSIDHVTITNGSSVDNGGGGGILNELGTLSISDSTISGNSARGTTTSLTAKGAAGGGIYSTGTTTLTKSVVSGNEAVAGPAATGPAAPAAGGGIAAKGGRLRVINSTISQNVVTATGAGGQVAFATGGGIAADAGTLANRAGSPVVSISGSTVSGNAVSATGATSFASGGGVGQSNFASSGGASDNVTIVNSTLAGNTAAGGTSNTPAGFGGAIGVQSQTGDTTTVINSTVAGNTSGGPATGTTAGAVDAIGNGTVTLTNTIVASNPGNNCAGAIVDGGHNISYPATDASCTVTFGHGNPRLGPLQNNGGPTRTMALGSGSAAIDTADAAACKAILPTGAGNVDQRGLTRTEVSGDVLCDIGAFEVQPAVVIVPTPSPTPTPTPTLPRAGEAGRPEAPAVPLPAGIPVAAVLAGAVAAGLRLRSRSGG